MRNDVGCRAISIQAYIRVRLFADDGTTSGTLTLHQIHISCGRWCGCGTPLKMQALADDSAVQNAVVGVAAALP